MNVSVSNRMNRETTEIALEIRTLDKWAIQSLWLNNAVTRSGNSEDVDYCKKNNQNDAWKSLLNFRRKKASRLWKQIKGMGGFAPDGDYLSIKPHERRVHVGKKSNGVFTPSLGDTGLNYDDFVIEIDSILSEIFCKACVKWDSKRGSFIGYFAYMTREVIATFWKEQALTSHHAESSYLTGTEDVSLSVTDFMLSLSPIESDVIAILQSGCGFKVSESARTSLTGYHIGVDSFYDQYIRNDFPLTRDHFRMTMKNLNLKYHELVLSNQSYTVEFEEDMAV